MHETDGCSDGEVDGKDTMQNDVVLVIMMALVMERQNA
jgi:hypothetical protein